MAHLTVKLDQILEEIDGKFGHNFPFKMYRIFPLVKNPYRNLLRNLFCFQGYDGTEHNYIATQGNLHIS